MRTQSTLAWAALLVLAFVPTELFADPSAAALEQRQLSIERSHRRHRMPIRPDLARLSQELRERFAGAAHGYVQFDATPDDARQRSLRKSGLLLLDYAGNQRYVAAVTDQGQSLIGSQPGIQWLGEIPLADKLAPLGASIPSASRDEQARIRLRVRFHETATAGMALSAIEQHRAHAYDLSSFEGSSVIHVAVDPGRIEALAAEALVCEMSPLAAPYIQTNVEAANLSHTDELWVAPFNLGGAGYTVGLWDDGNVFMHPEFGGRVSHVDSNIGDEHATHVAGTIAAGGNLGSVDSGRSRGMANQVNIDSYNNFNYFGEFFSAAIDGNLIASANGWTGQIGWFWTPGCTLENGCSPPNPPSPPGWVLNPNQVLFGLYTLDSRQVDQVAEFAETSGQLFLVLFPSGNDRGDGVAGGFDGTFFPTPGLVNPYYDSIGPLGTAKNVLTVGAVGPSKLITDFSGIGPTNDGRIKPDIVARGLGLTSPYGASAIDYQVLSGTSMATGVVTGSAVLVAERFENVFGVLPTNAELKAMLIHTAEDLGKPGPDYLYGYGLLDARAAVDLVDSVGSAASIEGGELSQGQSDTYMVNITDGVPSFSCTLVWMDRPGNNTQPVDAIVNNLDLTITSPSNDVYFPFSLDPEVPTAPATSIGPNEVDTVESIQVDAPEIGNWTVEVEALAVPLTAQRYSLVCNNGLAAPAVFDYLPPDGAFAFAYPYRRPILAAKYADSGGGTIDTGSVEVRIDSFDVTSISVVSQTGAYFVPTFDFWLGEIDFKINVANLSGVETNSVMTFNIVEAEEVTHLAVEFDGSGDAVLAWDPPAFSSVLVFTGYNVYRSTDLQTEMELIGQTFAATFTDDSVPAGPVYYEVHAELEGGSAHRIQTVRDTPFRTDQPFAVTPRSGEFTASGSTQVRILAMAEPGASVTFFADGIAVGNGLVAADGSVSLTHDFASSGAHTMWVQAKQLEESISIPSVPVTFQIP